jgi:AcrR family transcriptional regulator
MTTKQRIGRVATRQFARYGFDGTSIRQIVSQARVTKPVLYYYFKNKRGLYMSLLEGAVAPLCDEIDRIADGGGSPPVQLEKIIRAFLQYFRERPDHFQLLHQAVERQEREVQLIAEKYFRRIFLGVSRVLSEGMGRKRFRSLDVSQTTFSVIAIIVYYLTRAHVIDEVLGRKRASDGLVETLGQHVLGLLHL